MAVDTAAKRFSCVNVTSPWRGLAYLPTGTVGVAERQAVAFLYSGILAQAVAVPPVLVGQIPNITTAFNSGGHSYDLSVYFTGATSYAIAPVVEAGWAFDTGTAQLDIDTDAAGQFGPYIVTATNADGSTPSNGFYVTVAKRSGGGAAQFLSYGWPWHTWKVH